MKIVNFSHFSYVRNIDEKITLRGTHLRKVHTSSLEQVGLNICKNDYTVYLFKRKHLIKLDLNMLT